LYGFVSGRLLDWSGFWLICGEMVIENRGALSIRASRLIATECEIGSKAGR
jgi:hypothetical protein